MNEHEHDGWAPIAPRMTEHLCAACSGEHPPACPRCGGLDVNRIDETGATCTYCRRRFKRDQLEARS